MILKRSRSRSRWRRLREILWPSMGLRRAVKYLWFRLVRINSTPSAVALAVALGVAVSFTPFIGFHILLAAILAVLLRVNVTASLIGTVIGNPLTLPVFILLELETGLLLAQLFLPDHFYSADFDLKIFIDSPTLLFEYPGVYIVAIIGSIPWFLISGGLTYPTVLYFLKLWKARRTKRLIRRTGNKLGHSLHGATHRLQVTARRLKVKSRKKRRKKKQRVMTQVASLAPDDQGN